MKQLVKDGKGLVIWLCGLVGSGKSTIGFGVYEELKKRLAKFKYFSG